MLYLDYEQSRAGKEILTPREVRAAEQRDDWMEDVEEFVAEWRVSDE